MGQKCSKPISNIMSYISVCKLILKGNSIKLKSDIRFKIINRIPFKNNKLKRDTNIHIFALKHTHGCRISMVNVPSNFTRKEQRYNLGKAKRRRQKLKKAVNVGITSPNMYNMFNEGSKGCQRGRPLSHTHPFSHLLNN